jgi:hypothetical protein
MVNWYLSDHVRLEMPYGYGTLERFELRGKTHSFRVVCSGVVRAA